MSDNTLRDIDAAVAYLESPEYLDMARLQDTGGYAPYVMAPPTHREPPVRRPGRLLLRDSVYVFAEYLEDARPFKVNRTMRAVRQEPQEFNRTFLRSIGYLPQEYAPLLSGAYYVVYSYATPIAWCSSDTGWWWMPETKYSVTTSRHQSKIRAALCDLGITPNV